VQAIKLLSCKKLFTPEFFDSPTYQFQQDGIDSSATPQRGATSLDYGHGYIDNMDIFFDSLTEESFDTGLTHPTNLEFQTEPSLFHQTGERFTPYPWNGEFPPLHEQRTAMYGTCMYQFEQDGIDSSAAPQRGATSLDYGHGYIDNMDIFFDSLTEESIDTGLTYPTNLESTNLERQTALSWCYQTGELFYDTSHFTPHPLNGELPPLHEHRTAMYGTDETVPASGTPAVMLQTSTFNWGDQTPVPQNYQDLTSFLCQTIDGGPPYDRLVEFEQVVEGDDWCIPQVPQTQARRLGWWAIRNMVRACKIFLSRIRSRMVRIFPHPSKPFLPPLNLPMIVGTSNSTNDF
jgi:hypothetical protein